MGIRGITINGRHYESPDAMPPDVRRTYEAALRMMRSIQEGGKGSDTTEVFTGQAGFSVIRKTVTVTGPRHGSVEELPLEVRQVLEDGRAQTPGTSPGAPTAHDQQLVVETRRPQIRTTVSTSTARLAPPHAVEPWSRQPKLRHLFSVLVFWVVVGLILWAFLGR